MSGPDRLVVLVSGFGSNLQAILDACQDGSLKAEVVAVFSNKTDAYGLERARRGGIPAVAKVFHKGQDRLAYDRELAELVSEYAPDWVVLAGWMRILSGAFIQKFPNRIVNLHPALPGTFPGTHAIERAFQAFQDGLIDHTGVMVHLVTDEGVDNGPLLAKKEIAIAVGGTLEELEEKVHAVEHALLVETLRELVEKNGKPGNG